MQTQPMSILNLFHFHFFRICYWTKMGSRHCSDITTSKCVQNINIARGTTDQGYWNWNLNYINSSKTNKVCSFWKHFQSYSTPWWPPTNTPHTHPTPISRISMTPNNLYCRQVDHRHQLQRSMQHLADPLADILALIVHPSTCSSNRVTSASAGNHDSFVHIIISLEFFASEMWSFFPNQTGIGLENESSKL